MISTVAGAVISAVLLYNLQKVKKYYLAHTS